ncbi:MULTISPECIES: ABC transporter ATP-binding protein [unclassified Halorhodospira]|uniref:ABC transporter ATP-binding protein n=1 Tax=unclassified Halorhodospira TaxID=2626748 RepID=UPI001EE89568|nr:MULTISPECIES: ATP-binding cassette domain-containing protein [unclassified Halorhodospira]MCG5541789.1 ATP-binding cassette domain-containing protein [Halorhodospira sp. M39old]MCG5546870.1 ATP-binding cassette domain-containing protein [Halorhodospira sp. M38]
MRNQTDLGPTDPALATRHGGPVVALEGTSRIFSGGGGLSAVDLAVTPGEVVGVTGASGCGKSTLLRLIAGRETPDTGTIRRHYGRLGMVFQEPHLLPWLTAQGNIELVLPRTEKPRALEALRGVGLEAAARQYPAQLSGGMRQRVGIARALAAHPDLLLMDEPFASLDYINRAELLELVRDRVVDSGVAAVFVSHDVREIVQLCHRILVIGDTPGQIRTELEHPAQKRGAHLRPGALANLEERVLTAIRGHPTPACQQEPETPDNPLSA